MYWQNHHLGLKAQLGNQGLPLLSCSSNPPGLHPTSDLASFWAPRPHPSPTGGWLCPPTAVIPSASPCCSSPRVWGLWAEARERVLPPTVGTVAGSYERQRADP